MISFIVQGGAFDQMPGYQIGEDYYIKMSAQYVRIPDFEIFIDNDTEFYFLLITWHSNRRMEAPVSTTLTAIED